MSERPFGKDGGGACGPEPGSDGGVTDALARHLRHMPERAPPPELFGRVMGAVREARLPWRRRALHRLAALRFARMEARWAVPAGAVAVLCAFFLGWHVAAREVRVARTHAAAEREITLSALRPGAASVAVIGSFNGWSPAGYAMLPGGEAGVWTLRLRLPPGRHQYSFLVDGKEILPDPRAFVQEDDGFGNRNSVLVVGEFHEKAFETL